MKAAPDNGNASMLRCEGWWEQIDFGHRLDLPEVPREALSPGSGWQCRRGRLAGGLHPLSPFAAEALWQAGESWRHRLERIVTAKHGPKSSRPVPCVSSPSGGATQAWKKGTLGLGLDACALPSPVQPALGGPFVNLDKLATMRESFDTRCAAIKKKMNFPSHRK